MTLMMIIIITIIKNVDSRSNNAIVYNNDNEFY